LRLLVVDDEPAIVQAYQDFLRPAEASARKSSRSGSADPVASLSKPSYEILTALNGKDALSIVQREFQAGRRFAGAFFDVKMEGGMDGIQAMQEVWKIDP